MAISTRHQADVVYFEQLRQALNQHDRLLPTLLIDLDRLDHNIATLQAQLKPGAAFRIVVKSLPCQGLLDYIRQMTGSQHWMVFHQPFLTQLAGVLGPQDDVLIGKPMPVRTAQYFYDHLPTTAHHFDVWRQIQWLVDTPQRTRQYIQLAQQQPQLLRLAIEIDVGLHRGGCASLDELRQLLRLIADHPVLVTLSGLMGYDPHVVKIPSWLRNPAVTLRRANEFYRACIQLIQAEFPNLWHEQLTFNGAGSTTLHLHWHEDSPLNDLSAGSVLLKPTTFDLAGLTDYQPACFIATPILKTARPANLPGLEGVQSVLPWLPIGKRPSYFIYGGYWMADFCYPPGLRTSSVFGPSSNQSLVTAPAGTRLEVEDVVFLRPQQSEAVLLQFGDLLACRDGLLIARWPVLKNH